MHVLMAISIKLTLRLHNATHCKVCSDLIWTMAEIRFNQDLFVKIHPYKL